MRPRISVIVPTLGIRPLRLHRCVRSILAQDVGEAVEVVVVGDGTQDHFSTLDHLRGDRLILSFSLLRQGAAAARNEGLCRANGDIVAFVDDDDWLLPGCLERTLGFFDARPEAMAAFGRAFAAISLNRTEADAELIRQQREEWFLWQQLPKYRADGLHPAYVAQNRISVSPPPSYTVEQLPIHNPWPTPAVAVRREVFDVVGHWNEDLVVCEDWEMWARIGARFKWWDMGPPPLAAYSVRLAGETEMIEPECGWLAAAEQARGLVQAIFAPERSVV